MECFFFCKQKTAYEMRISDWSSDVCSSDLEAIHVSNAVRKLGQLALVLFLVTLFTALLVSLLPGDPAEVIIPFGAESDREALREELNLDEPLPVRYVSWLGDFVTGDLGNYYRQSITEPVADRVSQAAPVSLLLMLYAQVLALVIAIPLGVFTAQRRSEKHTSELQPL